MGYEEAAPSRRRGSMTHNQEKERRASIKAIMSDDTLTPIAKRLSIQHLMDGRRNSMSGSSVHSAQSSVSAGGESQSYGSNPYGYGDTTPNNNHHSDYPDNVYGYEDPDTMETQNTGEIYSICNEQTKRAEVNRPYCSHYERNCTIVSPCCGMAFGCRICHDDCPALLPKINNGGRRFHRSASLPSSFTNMRQQQEDTHHEIDRFAVREVICRECFTRQSSKTYVKKKNIILWHYIQYTCSFSYRHFYFISFQQPVCQLWCTIWSLSL